MNMKKELNNYKEVKKIQRRLKVKAAKVILGAFIRLAIAVPVAGFLAGIIVKSLQYVFMFAYNLI